MILDVESVLCCHDGCGWRARFTTDEAARLRRTHEWWCCPMGHRQYFSGKSAVEQAQEERDRARKDHEHAESALRLARERLEKAERAFRCPFDECAYVVVTRARMAVHLRKEHNATSRRLRLLPMHARRSA